MPNTTAKKITYDGKPVQVESAIRDGSGKVISSTYAPKFTVTDSNPTLAWGTKSKVATVAGTAINVTMPANPNTDTKNTAGSTNSTSKLFLIGATSQDSNPQTYSNSKVYETDGALVATTIDATQVGGETKTYTTGANTTRVILARVNNYTGLASCRIKLEIGPDTSSGAKVVYINAIWAGRGHKLTIESVFDWNNAIRYFYCVVPNNVNYYTSNPPEIHIQQVSAVARTVKATILERSGDVVLMDNLTTVGNTTNRNNRTYDVNNTIGIFDNTGYVQNSGWSNATWDTLSNDRFKYGEAVVDGSLVAVGTDGLTWKIRSGKELRLPLVGGRSTGTYAVNGTYGRLNWSIRGRELNELTNATMQGSAFTVPTWAIGNTIYLRGNIGSGGGFIADGTITNAMTNPSSGTYTYIPIGYVEKTNNNNAVYMTIYMREVNAFTIDTNGRVVSVNGKGIHASTSDSASSVAWGNVSGRPEPMIYKGTLGPSSSGATNENPYHPVGHVGWTYTCIGAGTITWSTSGSTSVNWNNGTGSVHSALTGLDYTSGNVSIRAGDMIVSDGSAWIVISSTPTGRYQYRGEFSGKTTSSGTDKFISNMNTVVIGNIAIITGSIYFKSFAGTRSNSIWEHLPFTTLKAMVGNLSLKAPNEWATIGNYKLNVDAYTMEGLGTIIEYASGGLRFGRIYDTNGATGDWSTQEMEGKVAYVNIQLEIV